VPDGQALANTILRNHASGRSDAEEAVVNVEITSPDCRLCTHKQMHYFFTAD
jgi:hypothetical protein